MLLHVWLARCSAVACVAAVVIWLQAYLGGFSASPLDTTKPGGKQSIDTGTLFNWHPLLMVAAYVVCMTEAINAWSWPALSR
jgi:hypothetical protein